LGFDLAGKVTLPCYGAIVRLKISLRFGIPMTASGLTKGSGSWWLSLRELALQDQESFGPNAILVRLQTTEGPFGDSNRHRPTVERIASDW
jgi:hypothetical protein